MVLVEKTWPYFPYSFTNGIPLALLKLLLVYIDVNERRTVGFVHYVAVSPGPQDGVSRCDRCL